MLEKPGKLRTSHNNVRQIKHSESVIIQIPWQRPIACEYCRLFLQKATVAEGSAASAARATADLRSEMAVRCGQQPALLRAEGVSVEAEYGVNLMKMSSALQWNYTIVQLHDIVQCLV